ncbi:MAG TPA: LEA type 2 family protein [Chryseosolibacter sp.]|nr:LEA type 2 family protein [Chryseosolibacter sp.]
MKRIFRSLMSPAVVLLLLFLVSGCRKPEEDIVLRHIRDVVVDAASGPVLKANAIFYNPNNMRGRLKKIDVEIFVNGKKAASVEQTLKTSIPAASEFTVPLEVTLAIKELGLMDTIFGMIGGKTFEVHYKGSLRLSYHGFPINVPVDYKDDVKLRF